MAVKLGRVLWEELTAPFAKRLRSHIINPARPSRKGKYDTDYEIGWQNPFSSTLPYLPGMSINSFDGECSINGGTIRGQKAIIPFKLALNASLGTQRIFTVPTGWKMRVFSIDEIHTTAGSDAGAVTATITKEISGQAPGAGVVLMSGTFDMKGTANTIQSATLTTAHENLFLDGGEMLSIKLTGTLTALAGVVITIRATPGGTGSFAIFNMNANAEIVDQHFYLCVRPVRIRGFIYVHSTAGSDAGAVTMQIEKCTGTTAAGSGTELLSTPFDCKATANVPQAGATAQSAATLTLAAGDRLAIDMTGTTTALAGVVVVIWFQPLQDYTVITFNLSANAQQGTDQNFWIADRDYLIDEIGQVHGVAGSDGGSVNLQVEIVRSTTAAGSGSTVLTNNSSAGFDLKGTANTVQWGTLEAKRTLYVRAGDRLAVDYAGTQTAVAGLIVGIGLLAM